MAEQNRTDPDWEDVRVFIALARHGSLSAAARALAVNHATIARRMRSLETAMGERVVRTAPQRLCAPPGGRAHAGPRRRNGDCCREPQPRKRGQSTNGT